MNQTDFAILISAIIYSVYIALLHEKLDNVENKLKQLEAKIKLREEDYEDKIR